MFKLAVVFCGLVVCSLGASVPSKFSQLIVPGANSRIVGGQNTTIEKFPWQVSIDTYGIHTCGGSLIKPNLVVTAAHCLRYTSAKDVQIRAGSTNNNRGGSYVRASSLKVHSDFGDKTKVNDIALIKLETPLDLGKSIQTIELATSTPKQGASGTVSGWGTESFYKKDTPPEILKSANLNVVSRENCMSDKYAYGESRIFPNTFCAAGNGDDSCQGDSGGPFVVDGKLAGIISWGFGCGESMFPGVYTDVSKFLDWITKNT